MKVDQYHIPVLLNEATEALISDTSGFYVDVTFGGGGHSRAILDQIDNGKLLAFDQDADASLNHITDDRFSLVRQNFRNIQNVCIGWRKRSKIIIIQEEKRCFSSQPIQAKKGSFGILDDNCTLIQVPSLFLSGCWWFYVS